MKKSIYLLLFSLLSLNSYSQEWEVIGHQADELKGNEDYTSYMFTDPNIGSFVCWSESEQCRIINSNGIFDYSSAYHQLLGSYGRLTAVVGLYDSNNNLKEKFDLTMYCDIDKPSSFQTRGSQIGWSTSKWPISVQRRPMLMFSQRRQMSGKRSFLAS